MRRKIKEYADSDYWLPEASERSGVAVLMDQPNTKQGTFMLQGVPLGGWQILPARWLDEDVRQKESQ